MRNDKLDDVRSVHLFQDLGRREVEGLARALDHVVAEPGRRLIVQGARNSTLYSILRGSVGVWRDGELKAVLGPGDTFGEITMQRFGEATATVLPLQKTHLLVMSREQYRTLRGIDAAAQRVQDLVEARLGAASAA